VLPADIWSVVLLRATLATGTWAPVPVPEPVLVPVPLGVLVAVWVVV
jgi:hypothetical protein